MWQKKELNPEQTLQQQTVAWLIKKKQTNGLSITLCGRQHKK